MTFRLLDKPASVVKPLPEKPVLPGKPVIPGPPAFKPVPSPPQAQKPKKRGRPPKTPIELPAALLPLGDVPSNPLFYKPPSIGYMREAEQEFRAVVQPFVDSMKRGRKELDRVCEEKGLVWGQLSQGGYAVGAQTAKIRVLIGHVYEFEVERGTDTYEESVEQCYLGIAGELEGEQA